MNLSCFSHACYLPRPSHHLCFDDLNKVWWRQLSMKLLIITVLQSPVTTSLLDPNILLGIMLSDTLNIVTDVLKAILGKASLKTFPRLCKNRWSGVFCMASRALPCRAVSCRVMSCRAKPRSELLGDSCKRLVSARVERAHVTSASPKWRHNATRDVSNNSKRRFSACPIEGL
jgi:hypothetical protein